MTIPESAQAYLKEAMLAICQSKGFARCSFGYLDMARAIQRTGLTAKQIRKWANRMRERRRTPESREIFLRLDATDQDKSVQIGRCFIICYNATAVLVGRPLRLPKLDRSRGAPGAPRVFYRVTGQLSAWNPTTREARMLLEKQTTSTKILREALALAGAKQVQICAFPRYDKKPAQFALRNVLEFAARPGSRLEHLGTLKTRAPPGVVAPHSGAGAPLVQWAA